MLWVCKQKQEEVDIMADMGTKDAAEQWGVTQAQVQKRCREGRILNATQDKKGSPWHIPKDAVCPGRKR